MPSAPPIDGLPAIKAVSAEVRRRLLALSRRRLPSARFLAEARKIVETLEPMVEQTSRDAFLANYLAGAERTAKPLEMPRPTGIYTPPAPPILPPAAGSGTGGDEPIIRLPIIERAAQLLVERKVLLPAEFRTLEVNAKRAAFTVARLQSVSTIRKVRDAILQDIREGNTLRQFRVTVADAVDSVLSPSQVETVYRTQLGLAQAAGQRAVIAHPMVADAFPYVLWVATRDTRVRATHLAMERHGQNGTAVYRRDDPIWEELWAPAEWNCRCAIIPLSLEDAAEHGSREARKWLETDEPPKSPEFAKRPYPIVPPAGWPRPGELAAAA